MKKQPILVPKDSCPLDELAKMGEETKFAWIFLHRNAVEKLASGECEHRPLPFKGFQELFWNKTDKYPETTLWIELHSDKIWLEVYRIDATDIAFKTPAEDPSDIIFLKMEE